MGNVDKPVGKQRIFVTAGPAEHRIPVLHRSPPPKKGHPSPVVRPAPPKPGRDPGLALCRSCSHAVDKPDAFCWNCGARLPAKGRGSVVLVCLAALAVVALGAYALTGS